MCLAIPGRITERTGTDGEVEMGGAVRRVSLQLVPEVGVGDYVLVHAGYAIAQVDADEAAETLLLLRELMGPGSEAGS